MNGEIEKGGTKTVTDAASMKDWLGRQRTEDDEYSLGAVRRLAAMLDQDPSVYRRGSVVPEAWYAILFGPTALQKKIGPDGHPITGGDDLMPPMHNTRRMFAGRRATFHKPLKVGDMVERVSTIRKVEPKTGRTGSFNLVTVVHELSAGSGVAVTEEQDLVYRAAVAEASDGKPAQQAKGQQPTEKADWTVPWTPDTPMLFRYSALTYNAHRIHYDLPYTQEKEGYPALVVNGGLTALMLVEAARPHLPGPIVGYDARALAPLFIGNVITLNTRLAGDVAETWAGGPDGGVHYRVNIAFKRR
jgi:3-methylfumaryl-CoA hydratase